MKIGDYTIEIKFTGAVYYCECPICGIMITGVNYDQCEWQAILHLASHFSTEKGKWKIL